MRADHRSLSFYGELLLVEDKADLMTRMGQKEMRIELAEPLAGVPDGLGAHDLVLEEGGGTLVFTYDTKGERTGITALLKDLQMAGITLRDVQTRQSSLEDIFVGLVKEDAA